MQQSKNQKQKKDTEKEKMKGKIKKKKYRSYKALQVKRSFLLIFYVNAVCEPDGPRCSH